ncbi:Phytoene/squalene synthetase [Sulfitobacter noctilucicola]|uniref:Phytoene/squalene synthetase n=1 Tax=Sulfitobacter noctilucicola TaxID=1342301 RepID=A0A7W6Q5Q4_9RHOB|nr:squalene/phytoene synthase family protein [Sulfitobacter noctilucicola]KIN64802.1 Phytoene/squalene synthetase [Sulfitobacter noctilucicola]MBB4174052.1 phytoene/squalene synthetase [Sulfitobacter noctilucicola]
MSFDADLNACAALVERADPWRFRAVMAAPVAARKVLFPLYAFNVEVARAPWVTQEPMIAEMRLQWWRDVCEEIAQGKQVRRHEVATPLAQSFDVKTAGMLDELVAARRWDIYKDAFEDEAHFARYIDQTSGHLTWAAAQALGSADEATVRDAAYAAGIAAWLRAIPELEARGRIPLLDGTPQGVRDLAAGALERLQKARANRRLVSRAARPGLLHIGPAEPILKAAIENADAVIEGRLPDPVEDDRLRLGLRALTGRW